MLERLKNRPDARTILVHHPGYEDEELISSVWRMRDVFRRSCRDLQNLLDGFDQFCKSEESVRPSADDVLKNTQLDVQKELFCLSCASKAIVDFSRKVPAKIHLPEYKDKIKRDFIGDPQHNFVMKLRNNLNHGLFFPAEWVIVDNYRTRNTSSHFIISTRLLLLYGKDFNDYAKRYISMSRDGIDVRDLFSSYTRRVEDLYDLLQTEIDKHVSLQVVDYRRCALAIRRHVALCELNAILHQLGANPYESLKRFLTTKELEEVMSMPSNSAGQVDRVITFLDEEGVCTSELRHKFYERFSVGSSVSS